MNKTLSVLSFYKNIKSDLRINFVNDKKLGKDKLITNGTINKPGLALTGFLKHFNFDSIQLLAPTETAYINEMYKAKKADHLEKICNFKIPAFIIQGRKKIDPGFIKLCTKNNIPVLRSTESLSRIFQKISYYLEGFFAPTTQIHGTLVDVYGTGLLIMGRSSIGKSEIALDLVERGHRLVADDVVTIQKKGDNVLMGKSGGEYTPFMEIRGLGILNVKEVFGTRAIRMQKRVELIVQLDDWKKSIDYERVGLEDENIKILGIEIPRVKLPIFPGKNITVIAETIALNLHLKVYGYNAAKEFNKILLHKMKKQQKLSKYLNKDYE